MIDTAPTPSPWRRRARFVARCLAVGILVGLVRDGLDGGIADPEPLTDAERTERANEIVAEQDRRLAEETVEITTTTIDRDASDDFYDRCARDGRTHRSCPNHPRGERCITEPTSYYCPGDLFYAEADAEALAHRPPPVVSDLWFLNTEPIRDDPRWGTVETWCDQWWDGTHALGPIEHLMYLRSAPTDDMLNAAGHVAATQLTADYGTAEVERHNDAVAWLDATCRPHYP